MSGRFSVILPRPAPRRHRIDPESVLISGRRWDRATWLLLCAACAADAPLPPIPVVTTVAVISGNRQQADPYDALAEPIQLKVLDGSGAPMAGVLLQLVVPIGGGSVPTPVVATDSSGFAETRWTMGPFGGLQELGVLVGGKTMATVTATTCDPAECFPPSHIAGALSDATLLTLATYESSGQAVHPDVVRAHGATTGFWLAITPYPNGNTLYENPSIFRSKDAATWTVPAGAVNPVVKPEVPIYLSDPDMVVNNDQKLWLYYRAVSGQQNIIKVMRSADGVRWDSSTTVVSVPNHQLVSPAVVRGAPDSPWQMWSVNAGTAGCSALSTTIERRTSKDGLRWSAPITADIAQPGQSIWHIDVQWIPARAEYWALYNTYPNGSNCATNALYLARSADGMHWTVYPSPIARAGIITPFKSLVYRSTFMTNPKATAVTLWMSGASYANNTYAWSTATVTTTVASLFAIASVPSTMLQATPLAPRLPPPEPDVGPGRR